MTRRAYLAGPVSLGGTLSPAEVERNIAAFRAARERLTAEGWEVLDPTEGADPSQPWAELMRRSIGMLLTAERVVMLHGWQTSRGALIERRLALELGIEVDYQDGTGWRRQLAQPPSGGGR